MKQDYVKPELIMYALKIRPMLKSGSHAGGGEGGIHSRGLGFDDDESSSSSDDLWSN